VQLRAIFVVEGKGREGREGKGMEEVQEPISPQKRKRRPSVRLGEIGYPASYVTTASYLLESAAQRKKQQKKQQQLLESGSSPVKAPRTRLLDHVAVEKKKKQQEEQQRWRSLEVAAAADERVLQQSADEEKEMKKTEAEFASTSGREVEPGAIAGRKVKQVRRKRAGPGARFVVAAADHSSAGKMEQQQQQQKIREEEEQERFEEDHLDAADDDGNAPGAALHVDEHETSFAKTSSSSLELFGDGVCGKLEVAADSRDPAATSAEEEEEGDDDDDDDDANPNSLGDEIQGAIEDGPMRRRGVGKQDMMEQGGTGRQSADNSDMAGENNGGANLVFAAKTSTRQCITLASGGVKGWLCALDLGKYSETFELNEVDNEVLPLLTMEDLREMGVHAVGARRKMFNAIQELQHSYGA
jgi:hypothetical protein